MSLYETMNADALCQEYSRLLAQYDACKALGLKLNMARGKPSKLQLDAVSDILQVLTDGQECFDGGIDVRNYGELTGIPCAKAYWADVLGCKPEQCFVGGSASLNFMFDVIARAYSHGLLHSPKPWCKEETVKFLCPSPGYDRHFRITELFGAELILVPMTAEGPDMDMVEQLVQDPRVKGIWCVPKFSNPEGVIPCTMEAIRAYHPNNHSLGTGQVLHCPYPAEQAELVTKEMGDLLVLDLVRKKLATNQIVLTVGYDIDNLADPIRRAAYKGKIVSDHYGRKIPRHAHGSVQLGAYTNSSQIIKNALSTLYRDITNPALLVRRINITAGNILPESEVPICDSLQMDLFSKEANKPEQTLQSRREYQRQLAVLEIQKKYGKNAILKGMNLEEHATTMDRNVQIGGHKA